MKILSLYSCICDEEDFKITWRRKGVFEKEVLRNPECLSVHLQGYRSLGMNHGVFMYINSNALNVSSELPYTRSENIKYYFTQKAPYTVSCKPHTQTLQPAPVTMLGEISSNGRVVP